MLESYDSTIALRSNGNQALTVYARSELNNFYKIQGLAKMCSFLPVFGKISCYFLFYREYFIVGPINQYLIVKIKLLTLFQH